MDKKIRSFRRLSYHFGNLDILTYPKDCDDNMRIIINPNYACNNEVLDEVYDKVGRGISKSSKHNG